VAALIKINGPAFELNCAAKRLAIGEKARPGDQNDDAGDKDDPKPSGIPMESMQLSPR
jgi:hypothetical protein